MIKGQLSIKEIVELTLKQAEEVLKKSTKWVKGNIGVCERANA
ncbi:UNVERIFIED_ORG: hypothetical protein ABID75_005759 [Bacillus proteolyticus]|nr:E12 [Bacillus cereus Rock4-2]